MALAHDMFIWFCAAAMLGCAVIWGRIILGDARRGKTNYRRMTSEASPDIFVTRRENPGKFWRLIFYKVLSLVFILALAVVFVLIGLGVIFVA